MPRHIGIVACSVRRRAALCYKTDLAWKGPIFSVPSSHPEVSLHRLFAGPVMGSALDGNDFAGHCAVSCSHRRASWLAAGADVLICPDNTIHQAFGRALRIRGCISLKSVKPMRLPRKATAGSACSEQVGSSIAKVYPEKLAAAWTASVPTLSSAKRTPQRIIMSVSWGTQFAHLLQNWG